MDDILRRLGFIGLIPVAVIEDENIAVPAAQALSDGGIDTIEITLRTPQGIPAISKIREACPDMLVGAGTVLSVDSAKQAVDAGAQYIVAPGFDAKLVEWCLKNNMTITPGCVTPSEISLAMAYGLKVVKFFPANIYGGAKGCQALHAPFGSISFIPTGGIGESNLAEYAGLPCVHAIGGGWLFNTAYVKAGNFEAITTAAAKAVSVLLGFELGHVGMNLSSDSEARAAADRLCTGFGLALKEGSTSYFTGGIVEINKSKGRGAMGHIAIRTNNADRAVYYLQKRGFSPDWTSEKSENGRTTLIYFEDEIGGFAVHLLQK